MSKRLFIADDDKLSLKVLERALSRAGYEVVSATNGTDAWSILQQEDAPTIAILDWIMPGIEGIEICRRLRDKETLTPIYVILLTSRDSRTDLVTGLQAGASDFISKPFDPFELLARVSVGERVTRLQATVYRLARYDLLTEILNRRSLEHEALREWSRSQRSNECLSCVMFDIDNFKKINDTRGHNVGDLVIAGVATKLRENSRACDVLTRFGGEEFCVLLPRTDESDSVAWAERLRTRIADACFLQNDASLKVTASFGVSQRRKHMKGPMDLIEEADQALLVAKRLGRNQVVTAGLREPCLVPPTDRTQSDHLQDSTSVFHLEANTNTIS